MDTSTVAPHPNFIGLFPLSTALGLRPVSTGVGIAHRGFDEDDVLKKLGQSRFNALMVRTVKSSAVFSCGHRTKGGVEVHCIYSDDLELFLKNGG